MQRATRSRQLFSLSTSNLRLISPSIAISTNVYLSRTHFRAESEATTTYSSPHLRQPAPSIATSPASTNTPTIVDSPEEPTHAAQHHIHLSSHIGECPVQLPRHSLCERRIHNHRGELVGDTTRNLPHHPPRSFSARLQLTSVHNTLRWHLTSTPRDLRTTRAHDNSPHPHPHQRTPITQCCGLPRHQTYQLLSS